MKYLIIIILSLLFTGNSFSQSQSNLFIKSLINNKNVSDFIDRSELNRSHRLGISYTNIEDKALISFDLDESIKKDIKANLLQYNINEEKLEDDYLKVTFSVPFKSYSKIFYLKSGMFISPSSYFSRNWKTRESKYFVFKISEPKYFNDYCIKKLDEFIDSMSLTLNFDEQQMKLLEKEKIYYILCKDENEIEQVTGFNTRGIYITAFDEVITTYNTHYHELAHLLINYKLKNLSLYTLPFFMEGFAVAVGGRGGISKNVVLDIGFFIQKSGFMNYESLITFDGFYKEDASMTYPVSGLYNAFLIKQIGIEKYLELYKIVNGNLEKIKSIGYEKLNLPGKDEFDRFLKEYENVPSIYVNDADTNKPRMLLPDGSIVVIRKGMFMRIENNYKFIIDSPFLFSPEDSYKSKDYFSKKYIEVIQDDNSWDANLNGLNPPKYGVVCDSNNINLYNFYTNEIIAYYSINFSIYKKSVPIINDKYCFFVNQKVFESDLDSNFYIISDGR